MWMVRAGKNAFLIDEFNQNEVVTIGWGLGDLKDKFKKDIVYLVNKTTINTYFESDFRYKSI